ncbi:hypothetical protein [Corynebacterium pygosceleis]|uniref:hypothetical protein n=1 Tax=Corynebacterium pygosceleis TaxID=2800406 RepID=UPI0019060D77|nr:hypothetical protein [Corynebacterium pygosceleis]MCL0120658.1 hypothetical protein [Corynebacterium pygosceleis]
MDKLTAWIDNITDGASLRQIAERLNTTHPTVNRRVGAADPKLAVELADAYGANRIDGLLAFGFIEQSDVSGYTRKLSLSEFSDIELAEDILRRLQSQEEAEEVAPVEHIFGDVDPAELEGLPYAADSSPDEPGPGDPGYHDGP